jgi:hypothetical protein
LQDEDRVQQVDPHAKACKAMPKQSGLSWPLPADRRLDQLVDLANEAGAKTHRNELAAAIIAAAQADEDALLELVLSWRRARVAHVVLDVPVDADVIYLPLHGRGRRKTAGS